MSEIHSYLWLVPALPLLAAAVITGFGPRFLRQHSHWPCIAAIAASCVCSVMLLITLSHEPHDAPLTLTGLPAYYPLFQIGAPGSPHSIDIGVAFRADELTAIMLVMVTFIGTLIATFAAGYMDGDPGYPRFFAEVSLFVFSMTLLVLGDNLILLFAGWEGVGLCSYLLIGFWFTKPSAADAARKAFLVTRIGDVGLMLGILLIWVSCDYKLDYTSIFEKAPSLDAHVQFGICFLLFCGAAGKSAQFPLHVWLPDAMEGPTPVSALIHAATMVTAGVYLVARCTPLFVLSPDAQLLVACIGGFTALFAALIALTQNDLKRVLAYSTLSQLGYMFLALGCALKAGGTLVTIAVVAAMFHLFTHAFFKALLFLSAGSVMHAMGNVIDMRRFSGLRKVMPYTHWTFLCGAVALAGIPPFSGFWSKDEILASALEASHASREFGSIYLLLFISGLVTAALTAFYTFRAYFMTFWGELKLPPEAGAHGHGHDDHSHDHDHAPHRETLPPAQHHQPVAHESPPLMTIPLVVLAVFAVGVGITLTLFTNNSFAHFLERTLTNEVYDLPHPHDEYQWIAMGLSVLIAIAGVVVAYWMYVVNPALPKQFAANVPMLYQLSLNKFFIDELYAAFILAPLNALTGGSYRVDQYVVDGFVDWFGQSPVLLGRLFRPVQNGLVQFYALAMVLGLTVFLLALMRAL
jgi:NADH-quinone oxidoreductase subunit L